MPYLQNHGLGSPYKRGRHVREVFLHYWRYDIWICENLQCQKEMPGMIRKRVHRCTHPLTSEKNRAAYSVRVQRKTFWHRPQSKHFTFDLLIEKNYRCGRHITQSFLFIKNSNHCHRKAVCCNSLHKKWRKGVYIVCVWVPYLYFCCFLCWQ